MDVTVFFDAKGFVVGWCQSGLIPPESDPFVSDSRMEMVSRDIPSGFYRYTLRDGHIEGVESAYIQEGFSPKKEILSLKVRIEALESKG